MDHGRDDEGSWVKVRKAVFPVAGLGTRFLPATKAQPKEMLPIVDKPAIQYAVEEAIAAGLDTIIMVTGRGKDAIENHFDRAVELEQVLDTQQKADLLHEVQTISELGTFCYIRQKAPLGLGHAVLVTRHLVGEEPFAVLLADDLIDARVPAIRQVLDVFGQFHASVLAVCPVSREEVARYGIIAGRPVAAGIYQVTDLVEKPSPEEAPSNLAIVGRYVLTPEIFEALAETPADARGEVQLTNGLRRLLGRQAVYAVELTGRRYDTGSKVGFLQATVELALKRSDIGKAFREYLKGLDLDAGVADGE
ncbi:MAG TPA: UTP--glucose-1-phosphate uridylyltransferase GalU [Candidatus Methylomirabilis sp.]|nr:UTP--glucose-1-phosphate uridylyltransferase GalU [Candidatus Methylomirabilis sp.]